MQPREIALERFDLIISEMKEKLKKFEIGEGVTDDMVNVRQLIIDELEEIRWCYKLLLDDNISMMGMIIDFYEQGKTEVLEKRYEKAVEYLKEKA